MARILYVSQGYTTHDRRFLEKLGTTSYDVWFLPCATRGVQYETRPIPPGIHSLPPLDNGRRFPKPINWAVSMIRFRYWVRTIKPDLVHAGPVQSSGFFAALWRCRPLLLMSWGSDVLIIPEKSRWLRWVTQFTLRHADMVLGDCQAVRDRVLALSPLRAYQIVFFPWGIDLNCFGPRVSILDLRKKLKWDQCRVVISTRSFEPIHGTFVFLDAMRHVLERRSDVRVILLGDGSLRPQVETFVKEYGLSSRILLPGQVPHELMPHYFNEADLYASATYSDGTSISLLEAMACGLPVIVTSEYGNREWVTPQVNGWLYPAGDAEGLAGAVLEALDSETGRHAMGKANLAIARERGDWEQNFKQLLAVYDRLLSDSCKGE